MGPIAVMSALFSGGVFVLPFLHLATSLGWESETLPLCLAARRGLLESHPQASVDRVDPPSASISIGWEGGPCRAMTRSGSSWVEERR